MNKKSKILVLGSRGLVGSALMRELFAQGYLNVLSPLRPELDLFRQAEVENYFSIHRPDYVFMAAAKVGGIFANDTYRADFIFENLLIQQNVFNAAFKSKTPNLLFFGSACIYPKNAPQPMKEDSLLTSPVETTSEPYAVAKIAGLKCAQNFRKQYGLNWLTVIPANLYGPNDTYHSQNSHVIPGMIARMHEAMKNDDAEFKIWGSGKAKREFLFVDDLAKACLHFISHQGEKPDFLNIGTGIDIEIFELAKLISMKMNFQGRLVCDQAMTDGSSRKLLDNSKIESLGWFPKILLEDGLDIVIKEFKTKNA
ncbi:MAG: GDP-L-fucose synthase [Bacteriovoracaceae bacterium]|nr:GDP-L-fucose synthase [Bacteriovoracaceae bacterium]